MKEKDIEAIKHYWDAAFDKKLYIDENNPKTAQARKDLLSSLSEHITQIEIFNAWLKRECLNRNADGLDYMLTLGTTFDLFDRESLKVLQMIACDDWHHDAENLVAVFEEHPTDFTNKILYDMALSRYPNHYYSDDENGSVTRKCVWALWRLGDIDSIKSLANSEDKIAEGYAQNQLEKLKKK
ncbi:hypothetical protein KQI86_07775 [Clostridium sp. MSJ-11]|uniref:HEAT repeat domain-containing protein n=1 Tax=Clostridium mobile TaxID=2841512 RepID=A0ABS6EHQ0_9CLOT|nr:hypothetical protein [Clostridium mobile]MBU5484226.1 hypothetical protein [Clostridium mobile]